MKAGKVALVDVVSDQLQFVQARGGGDVGLVAGVHQLLPAGLRQLGGAAAEHRLFAEQVGFGLLLEGGADGVLACTTDAGAIGQRKLLGPAGVVLVYGIDGGPAATDLVLAADRKSVW